jgi:hypothetical protein
MGLPVCHAAPFSFREPMRERSRLLGELVGGGHIFGAHIVTASERLRWTGNRLVTTRYQNPRVPPYDFQDGLYTFDLPTPAP